MLTYGRLGGLALLAVTSFSFAAPGDVLIVATRGETGSDVLKLDAETLGAVSAYEKDFWGPIASLLSLPDGNFVIIEKTRHGCDPSYRSGGGPRSGKASVCLVDGNEFNGFNYRDITATAFYSGTTADAIDGSLGGIVNRFGEIFLNQNASGNFDGAELFNGLDGALSRLYGEKGSGQTGSFNPPPCGRVGVALTNGDWVLAGYDPLRPNAGTATLEVRSRTNIKERLAGSSFFNAGVKEDLPTAIGINKNDKIALGVQSRIVRQLSFNGSNFTLEGTRSSATLAGGAIVAIGSLADGNWVVGANGSGAKPGRVWILKEGPLNTLFSLSNLPQINALGIRSNDDIVLGTESGQILVYDSALKNLKQTAGGFNPITHLTVLAAHGNLSKTKRIVKEPKTGVKKNAAWVNALKPKGKPGPELTLAADGKIDYVILCPVNPNTQEEKAASELASWLNQMTGDFPILKEGPEKGSYTLLGIGKEIKIRIGPQKFISLGSTDLMSGAGLKDRHSDLAGEGYRIAVKGGNLFLTGGERRGIINAVFALLEEDLGCRWYTKNTSTIPRIPELKFRPAPRGFVPRFEVRDPYYWDAFDELWSLRNRTSSPQMAPIRKEWGGTLRYADGFFVHTFGSLVLSSKYFKEHPEYFSEGDGKRNTYQLCTTHPEVLKIATARVLEAAKTGCLLINVSPNDGGGYCTCAKCKAVDKAEGTQAGTLLRFVNAIADAVAEKYPEIRIATLAYLGTDTPPKITRPRKNVVITFCTDYDAWRWPFLPLTEARKSRERLKGWIDMGANIYIWDYTTNFSHYPVPMPNMSVVTENIRFYLKNNIKGVMLQGAYQGPGSDRGPLRCWVWSKQLWDPSLDTRELIRDFNYGYYGQAAEPMQEYDDLLWKTWEQFHGEFKKEFKTGKEITYNDRYNPDVPFLSREFLEKASNLFERAEQLAKDEETLRRVKLAKFSLLYVKLCRGPGFTAEDYTILLNEFETIAKKEYIQFFKEGNPDAEEKIQAWRKLAEKKEQR